MEIAEQEMDSALDEARRCEHADLRQQDDAERVLFEMEKGTLAEADAEAREVEEHPTSHAGEMDGRVPELSSHHLFQCNMLARLKVCPWPQRRHRYQRRLDAAAQLAEVHLRKR
eukprot:2325249-Lingulodinium_polyedra.AAC.1